MQGGNWSGAEASFRRLVAQYPYGPYTEQAMIETAYAQYKAGKHDDAVSSIDRFIRTYPTHRNIAYLYYLRGLANSNRSTVFLRRVWSLDASRRDLSTPHQAYSDFNIVVDRYPNSRYAADARQRMLELRDVFAQHELDNALYYMRRGAWVSAVGRANYLLETYPQSAFQYDAVAVLADSYTRNKTLADDARRVLQLNQPDHPWLEGKWPKYPWMIRKLNPFAGEKSASTGQRNARLEKVSEGPERALLLKPCSTALLVRLPRRGRHLGMLRIHGGCDAGRSLPGHGHPHCSATATPAITERPMARLPCCSIRPLSCLLAIALLALTSAPPAAAQDAAGDLLSAAPIAPPGCRPRPPRPTNCTTAPLTTAGSWPKAPACCTCPPARRIGGWPVVSWAHGTQGIADRCAPSVSGPYQPERDGRFLDRFLAQGYAVVAADYQGLGSSGDHAYLHVRTAARNAIDMIKASRQYLGNGRCRHAGCRSAIRRAVPPRSRRATSPHLWWTVAAVPRQLHHRHAHRSRTDRAGDEAGQPHSQSWRAQRVSRVSARWPAAGRATDRPRPQRRRPRPCGRGTRAVPGRTGHHAGRRRHRQHVHCAAGQRAGHLGGAVRLSRRTAPRLQPTADVGPWQPGPRCALPDHPAVRRWAGPARRAGRVPALPRRPPGHAGRSGGRWPGVRTCATGDDPFNDAAETAGLEQLLDGVR